MTETNPPTREALCPTRADMVYRRWRRGYVFATTLTALLLASVLVFGGWQGELATVFLRGLMELATTMAILYLGAGVIDRSQILTKIGDGFRRGPHRDDWRDERRDDWRDERRDDWRARREPEALSDERGEITDGVGPSRRGRRPT